MRSSRRLIAFVRWLVALAVALAALAGPGVRAARASAPVASPADLPASGDRLELPAVPTGYEVVSRGFIDFAYPPSARDRVAPLVRDAAAFREVLRTRLGQPVLEAVHVRVARTPGEMRTLAPEGAPYPGYASGVAYPAIGLVLLTLLPEKPDALHDPAEIFRHELAHVALHDAVGARGLVPVWFNEGLAVHLSGESAWARLRSLSTATLAGRLVPLARLDASFPSDATAAELAYAQSADVVRHLLRSEDAARFVGLIGRVRAGQPFAAALRDAYGMELAALEHEWREDVARRYSFWPVLLGGTVVWVGCLALFALAWRRKRARSQATLERWDREEAGARLRAAAQPSRIRIVFPDRAPAATAPPLPEVAPTPPPAELPRVEHEGDWHTLH